MTNDRSARYRGQFRPEYSRIHEDRDLFWVVPFPVRYMVGVIGLRFAGKSTVLSHLAEKHGFVVYNLSGVLRELAAVRGVPLEPRAKLQDLGDEVRAERRDGGYLARLALRRIRADFLTHRPLARPAPRIVVGGFKHPEEVEVFEKTARFQILAVDATDDTRFGRAEGSGLLKSELAAFPGPPEPTIDNFRRYIDARDRRGRDHPWTAGYGQAVDEVMAKAPESDAHVTNDGTLADLQTRVSACVQALDGLHRGARG